MLRCAVTRIRATGLGPAPGAATIQLTVAYPPGHAVSIPVQ